MQDIIYDWNEQKRNMRVIPEGVELFDETLRDGIQSPSVIDPPIETKLKMIDLMCELGINAADVGLPGAGERAVNDVRAIAKHVRDNNLPIEVCAAGRTLRRDLEPIAKIRDEVGIPIVAYAFLGTSPIRQLAENWDLSKLMRTAEDALRFAQEEDLAISFVTEDTIRSKPDTLDPLFRLALNLGVRQLTLCDTVGHASPDGIRNLIDWTRGLTRGMGIEDVKLEWHGHNDRGLGVTNAIFAAEYGCQRIHGTCLGIGERVGNASIDQIILNLKLMGAYPNATDALVEYCDLTSQACAVSIPDNYPLVGKDAFRTATGVHAAAVIKAEKVGASELADLIYSGVPAGWFGKSQKIEIGPMSGLSNVRYWLAKRNVDGGDALANYILEEAKKSPVTLTDAKIEKLVDGFPG